SGPSVSHPIPKRGRGWVWLGLPAELLRLPRRTLGEQAVDQCRTREVHRLLQRALQVPRLLDVEALAAERLHHAVIAGAPNEGVGLHVHHRVLPDLRHAGPDAATVGDDDLD